MRTTRQKAGFWTMLTVAVLTLASFGLPHSAARAVNFTISGFVQAEGANLPGATVFLTGTSISTATTDASGFYSFSVPAGGTYSVGVYKNGFSFDPATQTLADLQSDSPANFLNGVALCAPASSGMTGWWKGENNANDASGWANNGGFVAASYGAGKVGQAMTFNGTTSFVTVADSWSLSPTGAITVAAWIKPNSVSGTQTIISKYGSSGKSFAFSMINGSLSFEVDQDNVTARSNISTSVVVSASVYQHVAASFDPLTQAMSIYVNGESVPLTLVDANTVNRIQDTPSPVRIGNLVNGSGTEVNHFGGQIDESMLFGRALTASEIMAVSNAASAGVCSSSTATGGGLLDISFGTGGKVLTQVGSGQDQARGVVVQADGKIVAVGSALNPSNRDFAIVRYNADGSLDPAFGSGGKVLTQIGSSTDDARAVAIQADGKIVVAGSAFNGSTNDFSLVRYNSDGTLDGTFGTGGKVVTSLSVGADDAYAMTIQSDGKIVVAGSANGVSSVYDFAVARYNSDGSLDAGFGSGGQIITPVGIYFDFAYSVFVQPDGKIVAAGTSGDSLQGYEIALLRLDAGGAPDASFGSGGKVLTHFASVSYGANSAGIQADGKIVVAGYSIAPAYDTTLVRFNPDGTVDSSFGTGGQTIVSLTGSNDYAYSMAIQADGKIITAGYALTGVSDDFAVLRFRPDGTLDGSFGTGGKVVVPVGGGSDDAYAVAIQPDGRIVAAGTGFGTATSFALARFNSDGLNVGPTASLTIDFSNIIVPGNTVATPLSVSQVPVPSPLVVSPLNGSIFDIRSSAQYSGDITVTATVSGVATSEICSRLRLMHINSFAYNEIPTYNAGTSVCTVKQTVTSLSPFAVAQLTPTAASSSISGRVLTADGRAIRNARVELTNSSGARRSVTTSAFGFYRFDDVMVGEIVVISVQAKNFGSASRVFSIIDEMTDIDLIVQ